MKRTKTSSTLVHIALTLFVVLFVFFLYTFLHESGHAIIGVLFGQSLTEFDISFWDLSAHVGLVGGELTEAQLALQAAAGTGLPLLLWAFCIRLAPRKAGFMLEILKLLSSMAVVNTLLAWIILPILFFLGKAPSDDVTNFLLHSQMPPLLLAGIALVLYLGGWILFLSKITGLRNQFLLFRTVDRERLTAGTRSMIPVMTAIMLFCVVLVMVANGSAANNSLDPFTPPQDFNPVAEIDLSTQAYPSETLAEFTVGERDHVGIFVRVRHINTTYFDLSVTGPDGFHSVVMHGEGYNAAQDGGLWEQFLPAGTYRIVLTSHQSPGDVSVYMKIR